VASFIFYGIFMFQFFYDSLETLQKVKQPTKKEVFHLTLIMLVVVLISAIIFTLMDGIFAELYKLFYTMMRG
jgi:preprotein translocase SecE subunit